MSDLIERQAAIEVIDAVFPVDPMKSEYAQGIACGAALAKTYVEQLPSAQPEPSQVARDIATIIENEQDMMVIERNAQQWIPCSERLPEIGQSVLLSVGGMYSAEGCLREDGNWAQFRWDAIQRKDMVGAWKPLPEPYKGGE